MLENTLGVVKASVNYANAFAQVEYVPTITNPQQLRTTLQSIGYDLMVDEAEEAKDDLEEVHRKKFENLKKRTTGAIALSIHLMVIGMFFMHVPYVNYMMWALATPVGQVPESNFLLVHGNRQNTALPISIRW